jgi:hypothetical protein
MSSKLAIAGKKYHIAVLPDAFLIEISHWQHFAAPCAGIFCGSSGLYADMHRPLLL